MRRKSALMVGKTRRESGTRNCQFIHITNLLLGFSMLFFRALFPGLTSFIVALATVSQLSAATLVNRYSFAANVIDSVGTAHGTLAGGTLSYTSLLDDEPQRFFRLRVLP